MEVSVPNFTEASKIAVNAQPPEDGMPALVTITQHAGGMHFMHAMLPHQAIMLAHALNHASGLVHSMREHQP